MATSLNLGLCQNYTLWQQWAAALLLVGREELGEGFLCYRTAVCVFFPEVKPQNFSEVFCARIRF